ncbi:hypothetical protein BC831DRAFT_396609 [Entophlyctis helioformis]|nr:hypothetical protein BC831DRAFT_396609 [Entophlyctis helioformis]
MADGAGSVSAAFFELLNTTTGIKPKPSHTLSKDKHAADVKAAHKLHSIAATKSRNVGKAVKPKPAARPAADKLTAAPAADAAHVQPQQQSNRQQRKQPTSATSTAASRPFLVRTSQRVASPSRMPRRDVPSRTQSNLDLLRANMSLPPLLVDELPADASEEVYVDAELDPWQHADLTWSDEAQQLKDRFLAHLRRKSGKGHGDKGSDTDTRDKDLFSLEYLQTVFKSLRLHGKGITKIDTMLLGFKALTELSLTGNLISEVDHLPLSLEILHLNANRITVPPMLAHLDALVHVGLSYNTITSVILADTLATALADTSVSRATLALDKSLTAKTTSAGTGLTKSPSLAKSMRLPVGTLRWLPPTIKSLDLAWNNLCNLVETVAFLGTLPHLKILCLQGNPLYLLAPYRSYVTGRLQGLVHLDGTSVSEGEIYSAASRTYSDALMESVKVRITASEMTGVAEPVAAVPENPDQPPDEYYYHLEFVLSGMRTESAPIVTQPVQWSSPSMDFKFSTQVALDVSAKLRDSFGGMPATAPLTGWPSQLRTDAMMGVQLDTW